MDIEPEAVVERSRELRGLWISVATYVVIFSLKLAAYIATGVLALLAESFHTLADIVVSGFLLLALYYSRRAPDAEHMFGHTRAQNVAGLVAATIFIAFTSLRLYEEAIPRLFTAADAGYGDLRLAIGVLVGSMIFAALPLVSLLRTRGGGASARAQLTGLVNDEIALTAALAGTVFIWLGWPIADPIAAILVATMIAWSGVALLRANASILLGQAPSREMIDAIERGAREVDGVVGVHDLRAEQVGPDELHAALHVEVAPETRVADADRIADAVRARVTAMTKCAYCVVQTEARRATTPMAPARVPG